MNARWLMFGRLFVRGRALFVFGFALRWACALLRLGLCQRMAGRRKRLSYPVENGSLVRFLATLVDALFQGAWILPRGLFGSDAKFNGLPVSTL